MTIVHQITKDSCFLACLESFFFDAGQEVTQQMIIDAFPEETHKGSSQEGLFELKGATAFANAERLQKKYGFKLLYKAADFDTLGTGDLIGAYNMKDTGCNHIVRFFEHADVDRIRVMDPKIRGLDCWTRAEFFRYSCYLFNVTVNAQTL
jgi:hypothetical protein